SGAVRILETERTPGDRRATRAAGVAGERRATAVRAVHVVADDRESGAAAGKWRPGKRGETVRVDLRVRQAKRARLTRDAAPAAREVVPGDGQLRAAAGRTVVEPDVDRLQRCARSHRREIRRVRRDARAGTALDPDGGVVHPLDRVRVDDRVV